MQVYRIVSKKWANCLQSPGIAGRWNKAGVFVLYTSSTRSLACLENMVHRSFLELNIPYCCMVIEIPEEIEMANTRSIKGSWFDPENIRICQDIGEQWIKNSRSPVLKVPSAIIDKEFNYVINMKHDGFAGIKLINTETFIFDHRLK